MAKCRRCGNSGLFLKLNALGLCSDCEIAELSELRIQNREQAQKIYQLTQRIAELKDQYNKAIANQKNNKVNESYPSSSNQTRYSSAVAMGSVSAHEANFCDEIEKLKQRYIAFDVETTGLNPYTNKIIEVGAVLFENGKLVKEFGTLVNANCDVPRSASSINHITGDMIRNAPSESEVYSKLIDFLGDALNEQTVICAHNAKFDMDFLSQTLMRLGYNGKIVYIDTLRTARNIVKGLPDYKQPTLAKHFMIENEQAHRATADAKVCGQILSNLITLDDQEKENLRKREERAELEKKLKQDELRLYEQKRNEIIIDPINNRIPLNEIQGYTEQDIIKAESYRNMGENVRKSGDFELAIQLYDKARCSGCSSPELYESYALIYRKLKDYDNEIAILDEAICKYKDDDIWYEKFEIRRYKALCLWIKQKDMINKKQKKQDSVNISNSEVPDSTAQNSKGRSIIKMNDDMVIIKEYESIAEASRDTGISSKSIRSAATGIQKHAGGFTWKYSDSQSAQQDQAIDINADNSHDID